MISWTMLASWWSDENLVSLMLPVLNADRFHTLGGGCCQQESQTMYIVEHS